MKKINAYLLIILSGLSMFQAGLIIKKVIRKKVIENRCWNMPLNDFYKDKECMKLMEEEYE